MSTPKNYAHAIIQGLIVTAIGLLGCSGFNYFYGDDVTMLDWVIPVKVDLNGIWSSSFHENSSDIVSTVRLKKIDDSNFQGKMLDSIIIGNNRTDCQEIIRGTITGRSLEFHSIDNNNKSCKRNYSFSGRINTSQNLIQGKFTSNYGSGNFHFVKK